MRVKLWGTRGSLPTPGPQTVRYGGNTSCVQVTLDDGTEVVLDAGTGIRALGLALRSGAHRIHILLTHLHLDHIQGLLFFAPMFSPDSRVIIWGPASPDEEPLENRIGRYLSQPLSPVEVRELPCDVSFRDCPGAEWELGSGVVRAESVNHRGPTLGYRVTEGDASLCYLPDHEPGLGGGLEGLDPEWISGFGLARDASLLIHDCQYADDEYGMHVGWGHSSVSDALCFADKVRAQRVLLFHHDPMHADEDLDSLQRCAQEEWHSRGRPADCLEMAIEQWEGQVD